ncbi:MAG: cyclopropane fatty acyl phospholipid synthase [Actinobacteria bacterium]|jgi:cyclopropane-fatty-acyl-phospholipid synthase|nr:cyclopropane fatty acyl phospholipid synthase [Actinomycetota bacterium]
MNSKALCHSILATAEIPINSHEPWSIHVHNEKLWDRIISQHQLGLGEAYMDGWWDCQAVDQMLTRLLSINVISLLRPSPTVVLTALKSTLFNRQTKSRAAKNAKHHYNIGNELYSRMLDKEMAYSCAYWKDATTLDQAQINKFDLICRKLKLEPGMKLLDIGSGWGGLLRHAVKNYGVIGYGISPAENQIEGARQRSVGLDITYMQQDYRELTGEFDRVVSVGMMEHVGPKNLRTFFTQCDRLLSRNGLMLHHTITSTYSKSSTDPFFDRYIFPGGVIPSPAQICQAAEKLFIIEDVHNFGLDYDRTLLAWYENINRRWSEIPQYERRFQRMWNYYLLASAAGFRARNLNLMQFVFRKNGPQERYISER